MTLIQCLMKTGLTRHESELYVALCREGEMNGYEAAKATGIPRAMPIRLLRAWPTRAGHMLSKERFFAIRRYHPTNTATMFFPI